VNIAFKDSVTEVRLSEGDCLNILGQHRGRKANLVYLDPPYFLNREFRLEARRTDVSFQGSWHDQEVLSHIGHISKLNSTKGLDLYLSWLYERLVATKKVMSDDASIFLHIGTREGPAVSLLLDELFGSANWRSTITWQRSHPHNNVTKSLGNVSDYIYYYSVSDRYTFNLLYSAHDETYLNNSFNHSDERGRYALAPIIQERARKGHFYEHRGTTPSNGWRVKKEQLERLDEDGYIHWGENRPYKKIYLDEAKGTPLQNIWTDVANITRTEIDRRRYPTQKPLRLLERIVCLASKPGDLVLDPFCGSGTTVVAAALHGRAAWGIDESNDAIRVASERVSEWEKSQQSLFGSASA
jgi:site-specific DNA-methyltransferase (adenine-specific)